MKPKALGGPILDDTATKDRRVRLADLACRSQESIFAKSLVKPYRFHVLKAASSSRSTTSATKPRLQRASCLRP